MPRCCRMRRVPGAMGAAAARDRLPCSAARLARRACPRHGAGQRITTRCHARERVARELQRLTGVRHRMHDIVNTAACRCRHRSSMTCAPRSAAAKAHMQGAHVRAYKGRGQALVQSPDRLAGERQRTCSKACWRARNPANAALARASRSPPTLPGAPARCGRATGAGPQPCASGPRRLLCAGALIWEPAYFATLPPLPLTGAEAALHACPSFELRLGAAAESCTGLLARVTPCRAGPPSPSTSPGGSACGGHTGSAAARRMPVAVAAATGADTGALRTPFRPAAAEAQPGSGRGPARRGAAARRAAAAP